MSGKGTRTAVAVGLVVAVTAAAVWLVRRGAREALPETDQPQEPGTASGSSRGPSGPADGRHGRPHATGDIPTAGRAPDPTVGTRLMALPMSDAVRGVVGSGTNRVGSTGRRASLKELTRDLAAEDVAALRLFLHSTLADQTDGLDGEDFFALKNDVLDILVRQERFPPGLGIDLAEMYRDRTQDVVWRDYCVQYLADCHARLPQAAANAPAAPPEVQKEREAILAAYGEALKERDSTIAGTALIGMEQVSRSDAAADREALLRTASDIASDDAASEASRITALRVAALMGSGDVLPAARMLAQVGGTDTLRLAAVATLGDVGVAADLELLQALSATADGRARPVVDGALKRLKDRLARPAAAGEGGA